MKPRRRILIAVLLIIGLPPLVLVMSRLYSALQANGRIYTLNAVPQRPVAIIFGAQVYANGNPSAMLADRIAAGAELYRQGKVRALLLTGDNGETHYNEPEAMRRYALSLGVPSEALTLDYAGFRTYDSCYRARDIFGVEQAILVTQAFHLDRALLICNSLGVESVGVAADVMRPTGYANRSLAWSTVRELPSTVVSIADLVLGVKPTFLGKREPIFLP